MSAIRNKQRLIHLYRYLMDYTDEDHQATTNDLVDFFITPISWEAAHLRYLRSSFWWTELRPTNRYRKRRKES